MQPRQPRALHRLSGRGVRPYHHHQLRGGRAGLSYEFDTIHRFPWTADSQEVNVLLHGAEPLAPPEAKRPPRQPFTVERMTIVRPPLDLRGPRDATVWACLITVFYTCTRLGKFTVPNRMEFNSALFITRAHVCVDADREGNRVVAFYL